MAARKAEKRICSKCYDDVVLTSCTECKANFCTYCAHLDIQAVMYHLATNGDYMEKQHGIKVVHHINGTLVPHFYYGEGNNNGELMICLTCYNEQLESMI